MANAPATVGIEVVLSVALPFLFGRWLDQRFDTSPTFAVIGFLLGCGAAGRAVYRAWKHMQEVARREEEVEGNPRPLEDDEIKKEHE